MIAVLGAMAALAVVWMILCLHAEQPKSGTLEWIALYDKPLWHYDAPPSKTDGFDLLWGLIPGVLYGALWCYVALTDTYEIDAASALLTMVLPAVLVALCAYLTARRLGAGIVTALCASLLLMTLANVPAMLLPTAGILLLLTLWAQNGYGVRSWLCLAGCAVLLALEVELYGSVLLAVPLLVVVTVVLLRRFTGGECSLWRLPATLGFLALVYFAAEFTVCALVLRSSFPALFADAEFYGYLFAGMAPEFSFGGEWRLQQLVWFDLPHTAVVLAGIPLLAVGAFRRHDRAALYLLIWDVAAVALWLTTYCEILPLVAMLTCAWAAQRMFIRKHRALAILTLTVPAALTVALTAVQLFHWGGYF